MNSTFIPRQAQECLHANEKGRQTDAGGKKESALLFDTCYYQLI